MKIAILQLNTWVGDCQGNADKIIKGYGKACLEGADIVVAPKNAIIGCRPRDLLRRQTGLVDRQYDELKKVIRPVIGAVPLVLGMLQYDAFSGSELPSIVIAHNQEVFIAPENFVYQGKRIAFLFGEDIFDIAVHKKQDPDLVLVLSASPYYCGLKDIRYKYLREATLYYRCTSVYVNQVGGNDDLIFDGSSFAINKKGQFLGMATPFCEEVKIIDTNRTPDNQEVYLSDQDNLQQLIDALALGTKDYLQKTGHKGAIVALSGGADSALVAYIACLGLGPENVLGVAMPSPYSSPESVYDATQLAAKLGIEFMIVPIGGVFDAFGHAMKPVMGWNQPGSVSGDPTEENFQPRIRGTIVMGLANRWSRIVLATGNKSEASVGYCTLYGDTCGGLGVIPNLPKTLVYSILKFINRHEEIIPWSTITKAPSAELRPGQIDQDTLPPYEILDQIIALYRDEGRGLPEIIGVGFDKETVRWVIEQVHRSEHKRQQGVLGLRIMKEDFYPKHNWPLACKVF
jgi:NAD+ synthase (glutamine-hydrolysing)